MRKVSSPPLILLLLALLVFAATTAAAEHDDHHHRTAHKEAVTQAAQTVMDRMAALHKQNAFAEMPLPAVQAPPQRSSFGAKDVATTTTAAPAATCDQVGYANVQVQVLAACPMLSGLFTGTVSITDFLPTFCGSNCYKVIAANLPKYVSCLDSTTKPLVAYVNGCVTHPECYATQALTTGLQVQATCGTGLTALFNFRDSSSSAKSTVSNFCQTCLAVETAYMKAYPRCVAADATAAAALSTAMNAMCQQTAGATGDYCSWNLRSISKVDCTNNCYSSDWCDSSCNLAVTTSNLNTMCNNTCLSTLASVATAVGVDKVLVTSLNSLFCAKAANSTQYCYTAAQAALASYSPSNATAMAATCSGSSGICLTSFYALSSALASANARATFTTCAASLSSATNLYSSCQSAYERSLRSAEVLRTNANLVCATNATGGYCVSSLVALQSGSCLQFAASGQCSTTCAASLGATATAAGCCLGPINDYLRVSSTATSYSASYLPTGTFSATLKDGSTTSYTFTAAYAVPTLDRSMQPLNALAVCSNTSDLWASIETPCTASTNAVARSFSVRLSYAAVTANAATRLRVMGGLKADAANAAGVPPSRILNESISADTSITVTTTSRRASSSGVKYSFVIDGSSASDAAAAAASFDTTAAKTTGIATVNTGNAASSGCTGCVASGQDASSLSSSSGSGGSSSSATTLSVAAAAFASMLALAASMLV